MNFIQELEQRIQEALTYLTNSLQFETFEADTHHTLLVAGWNDTLEVRKAVACYLVALRASAIDAALTIRAALENTSDDRREVAASVEAIVGQSNLVLSDDKKRTERNPWLAEGIWHLCLALAQRKPELHPMGTIVALDFAHVAAKDHGLDVAAVYSRPDGLLGLSLVETKAYKDDPNGAINQAINFFRKVDEGVHDTRIRQTVQIIRPFLSPQYQTSVSNSFWKRHRSYIPNPHFDETQTMDWATRRPSFSDLRPDKSCRLLMPHVIADFDGFFDSIADEMRLFVSGLPNV